MRVVFASRVDFLTKPGGDTTQTIKLASALEQLGHHTEILDHVDPIVVQRADILQIVNLDRPMESLRHLESVGTRPSPVTVLASIHHPMSWMADWHGASEQGLKGAVGRLTGGSANRIDHLREVHRGWLVARQSRQLRPLSRTIGRSPMRHQRELARRVDGFHLLADTERASIEADLDVVLTQPTLIAPNGIEFEAYSPTAASFDHRRGVVSIGRIEARKNPRRLLEVCGELSLPVTFVGRLNDRERGYGRAFLDDVRRYAGATYLGAVPHHEVAGLLDDARVHASLSWAEVLPLVDFESAGAGCGVLATTRSYTHRHLGGPGFAFWDPSQPTSHTAALAAAYDTAPDLGAITDLRRKLSWSTIAEQFVEFYTELLARREVAA